MLCTVFTAELKIMEIKSTMSHSCMFWVPQYFILTRFVLICIGFLCLTVLNLVVSGYIYIKICTILL
jgi:hypothetical protein